MKALTNLHYSAYCMLADGVIILRLWTACASSKAKLASTFFLGKGWHVPSRETLIGTKVKKVL